MSGADTFRGISFQAAFSVELALEVLEGEAEVLLLEGTEDVIDARLQDASGAAAKDIQAKTKAEPYVWEPGEVMVVIQRWSVANITDTTRFDFVSDGSLGPTVTSTVVPLLRRASQDALTSDDKKFLAKYEVTASPQILGRVSLRSRQPDARTLLERAVLRVIRLRELTDPVDTVEAETIVLRLFQETTLRSGEQQPEQRTLSRVELAEIVGVSLDELDTLEPWSAAERDRYLESVAQAEQDPAWALLDLVPGQRPPALAFVLPRHEEEARVIMSASALLEVADDILVCGPAGAGKTTTLSQLQGAAVEAGLFPISLRIDNYVSGSLRRLLKAELERHAGRRLPPAAVGTVLDEGNTVVLVDGAGELVPERRAAAVEDLVALRKGHGDGARFILAARDPTSLARAGLAPYDLQGLDWQRRRTIAASLLNDYDEAETDALVREIEKDLSGIVDNPLLFVMAVGLRARGVQAQTRSEVFDGFIVGLQQRTEGAHLSDAALATVRVASHELRLAGLYSADRWWWLEQATSTRASLIEEGTFSESTPAADELVDEVLALGLLRSRSEGAIGLLHDLFADYFAAEAVRHGLRELPEGPPDGLEDAIVFLAERDALDPQAQLRVCALPIAAIKAADILPTSHVEAETTEAMLGVLRQALGSEVTERIDGTRLRIFGTDRRWAGLGPEGDLDAAEFARAAAVTTIVGDSATALSVAVDLWLGCVRLGLARQPGKPFRAARDTADLVALIEEVVEARVRTFEALLRAIVPGLADRVRAEVGPMGIAGFLQPPQTSDSLEGDITRSEHLLLYTPSDGVNVQILSEGESPDVEVRSRAIAETWVYGSATEDAVKEIRTALETIMPRFNA
jgi:hypothetical protein